jgi:hypothetical protein
MLVHVWRKRRTFVRIATRDMRDWRELRDNRNQGLYVAHVSFGVPVARLRRWRTFSASC